MLKCDIKATWATALPVTCGLEIRAERQRL